MRLFKRHSHWYIEYRGVKKSLRTTDEKLARAAFKAYEKKSLAERLHIHSSDELILLESFIAEYKEFRRDKNKNTQRADALALQKLLDFYGNRPMVGLKAKVLDKFRSYLFNLESERSKKQVKPNTVNNWIRHLRIALKAAMRWGYLPPLSEGIKPMDKKTPTLETLKTYRVDLRKNIPVTEDDIRNLLAQAKEIEPCMVTAMAVQYYCGLGRAEVFSTIVISEDRITYRRKKTGKLKSIKFPDGLVPYIAHLTPGMHKLVPWESIDTYSDKFAMIARKAGIKISSHAMRHAFATHLLNKGARLEDVSELMDHSSVDITKRFYGHISSDRLNATINLLNLTKKVK
ncbi:MAG TPA: tyrosine-type recombinase/integrase [Nitrospirota bacterium]|nr:tyrosine-type recombinase/integrase [Nitrospirota bacterium]